MRGIVVALALALVAGCGPAPAPPDAPLPRAGSEGDCTVMIAFAGRVYRAVSVVREPRLAEPVGTGRFADCDGTPMATEPSTARLLTVPGADPSALVYVDAGPAASALYVDQSIKPSQWPEVLREASRYPSCTGPASFVARWRGVDAEDLPNPEDLSSTPAVPYTLTLTALRGSGVDLDRWREVDVRVTVDRQTEAAPTAGLVHRVGRDRDIWHVVTRCTGSHFALVSFEP